MSQATAQALSDPSPTPQGQPRGLYVLFFVEMWERFSYYGMRALLTLYLTKQMLYGDKEAAGIYGAYTALVYATPILGGLIAERLLGYRKAILLGGVLMMLGHFVMAFPNKFCLFLALSLLVAGNGFFKPNISSLVGNLYEKDDPRRDGGFTIFYMGINLGAFFSPIVCGLVGEKYGWHYGFGLAGIGMLIGLLQFMAQQGVFSGKGLPPSPDLLDRPVGGVRFEYLVYAAPFVVLPLISFLIQCNTYMKLVVPTVGLLVFGSLLATAMASEKVERERLFVVVSLTFFSILFWSFFEQAGSSLTLFTDRNVERHLGGFEVSASLFQSVNPVLIVALAPLFARLWDVLEARGLNPSAPVKFSLAIVQLGLGFGVLVLGSRMHDAQGLVPMVFILLAYLLHTTGELCLSPVGLSMVTKLSPDRITAVAMGTWLLSSSFAGFFGGELAKMMAIPEDAAPGSVTPLQMLPVYSDIFYKVAVSCLVCAAILGALSPVFKRWMHGVK